MKVKNISFFLFQFSFVVILFSACEEEPPYINLHPPLSTSDTAYLISPVPPAQPKEVLIEDISGASCKNCPDASVIGNAIAAANPGRVNIATIYPNISFGGLTDPIINKQYDPTNSSSPFVNSKYDLRTEVGKDLVSFVTVVPSLPGGYIDRKKFTGSSNWYVAKENWSGNVTSELAVASPVNIEFTKESKYNSGTKKLTVEVMLTYTAAVTGDNYLHLVLLQDSIIDAQERTNQSTGLTIFDSAYVHRHVVMDMLTARTGDLLNTNAGRTLVPGRVFKIKFEKTLGARIESPSAFPQPQWNPNQLKVLAIVTEGATTKYVLQSKEFEAAP